MRVDKIGQYIFILRAGDCLAHVSAHLTESGLERVEIPSPELLYQLHLSPKVVRPLGNRLPRQIARLVVAISDPYRADSLGAVVRLGLNALIPNRHGSAVHYIGELHDDFHQFGRLPNSLLALLYLLGAYRLPIDDEHGRLREFLFDPRSQVVDVTCLPDEKFVTQPMLFGVLYPPRFKRVGTNHQHSSSALLRHHFL